MFELISGMSGVIVLVICLYVFRRPIKTMTDVAPEVVENAFSTVIKSSKQLDTIVSTNCAENEVDCRVRMKAVVQRIKEDELPTVDEAYAFVMGTSKANM